jgi:hypothetical protein
VDIPIIDDLLQELRSYLHHSINLVLVVQEEAEDCHHHHHHHHNPTHLWINLVLVVLEDSHQYQNPLRLLPRNETVRIYLYGQKME